jgi:hypothetical protein
MTIPSACVQDLVSCLICISSTSWVVQPRTTLASLEFGSRGFRFFAIAGLSIVSLPI